MKITEDLCDVYREACFSQEMLTNEPNMGLQLEDSVEKTELKNSDSPVKERFRA